MYENARAHAHRLCTLIVKYINEIINKTESIFTFRLLVLQTPPISLWLRPQVHQLPAAPPPSIMAVQAQAEAHTFAEGARQPGHMSIRWSRSEAWMGVQIPPSTQSHARRRGASQRRN